MDFIRVFDADKMDEQGLLAVLEALLNELPPELPDQCNPAESAASK